MKLYLRKSYCVVLFCLFSWLYIPSANAQQPLTLKDALEFALKNNTAARKAALDVQNGNYKIDETRARALPQLSINSTLVDQYKKQSFVFDGSFVGQPGKTLLVPSGTTWNSLSSLNLEQKLFDQSVFTGLKAAKSTQEYYQLAAQLTDEQLIEQVATSYYQVLVQQQQVAVIDSNIDNTTRVYNIINGLYQSGLAKKIDVDRTQVAITNLKAQRQQLINAAAQQENALKFYMGMDIATPIVIPPAQLDTLHTQDIALQDSLDFAGRTEYRIVQKQDELYRYNRDAYKAEYYPSLSLAAPIRCRESAKNLCCSGAKKTTGFGLTMAMWRSTCGCRFSMALLPAQGCGKPMSASKRTMKTCAIPACL